MTPTPRTNLSPSPVRLFSQEPINQAKVMFLREMTGRCLRHVTREHVPIADWGAEALNRYSDLIEASDGRLRQHGSVLLRHEPDLITLLELGETWGSVITAGAHATVVQQTCDSIATHLRKDDDNDDQTTSITFWAWSSHGPERLRRDIATPGWDEIAQNYAAGARIGTTQLLHLSETPAARMILWHGPPGTGKTHAARALAHGWRDWCDVAFIADSEEFFGRSIYLFKVATDDAGRSVAETRRRGKLIVLEDAGELMALDARRQAGQGLSRLLNLTDGLIGQGLNVMVLITTNEPLESLHPAVTRPGRCLAQVEFGAMSPDEANAWLARGECPTRVTTERTLADLYALLRGEEPTQSQRRPIGFAA